MRVCYLINRLAPGGAPTLLLDIVRGVDAPDISVTVCQLEQETTLAPEFEAAGARVVDFAAEFKFDPRALARLVRFFRRESFDVLHTHLPYAQVVGRVAGAVGDVDHLVSTHHNVPAANHPVTATMERATRWLDEVTIAVSEGVEIAYTGSANRYDGHRPGQWCTIYNGIDVDGFEQAVRATDTTALRERWGIGGEPVFLNVARYVPEKAQHDLVTAMETVVERVPDAQLLLVGWGQREAELREMVSARGLDEVVTVTGRVPTIHEYYALADVFVSSSVVEGLPITHLEAMATGLPVVGTDIPGAREAVRDGETGLLVPPEQPTVLGEAMCGMADRQRRLTYGEAGRELVETTFSIEQTVRAHVQLYRDLVA